MSDGAYAFEGLPVAGVRPGTSVLVAGSPHDGATDLVLRMLVGGDDEATVLVSTNSRATRIIDQCEAVGMAPDPARTGVVDCVGEETDGMSARVLSAGGPGDLTGIGIRFSTLSGGFRGEGIDRIRSGIVSVSTLLSFSELRTVSRFVHTLTGRVDVDGGLGVFLVDPAATDDRAVSTVGQFCDARIDVRDGEDDPELRARGIPDQPRDWMAFDPRPG